MVRQEGQQRRPWSHFRRWKLGVVLVVHLGQHNARQAESRSEEDVSGEDRGEWCYPNFTRSTLEEGYRLDLGTLSRVSDSDQASNCEEHGLQTAKRNPVVKSVICRLGGRCMQCCRFDSVHVLRASPQSQDEDDDFHVWQTEVVRWAVCMIYKVSGTGCCNGVAFAASQVHLRGSGVVLHSRGV